MKKDIILWLLFPLCSWGQTITNHKNAIVHSSFRVGSASISDASDATKALISIQYTDGLGRPLQTVGYRQSPTAKDIVFEGKTYDTFGRPFKTALTAPTTVQTGEYQANPSSLASTFYGDNYAYSEITAFDNSPLNRLKIQYGPGQAWRTNTKNIQTFDEIAGATIRLYDSDVSGNITLNGNFPANSLYKIRVIDEQGNTTVEIKDKSGNLIQREQPVGAETLITYYVYDQWQRLRAVMQPEAYALNASIAKDSDAWTKWVFGYNYDAAGRLIEKHTPGGGWGYTVYDRNDFPVLTQDASQNGLNKWSFTKYDQFGRNIVMGELENTSSRAALQTSFNGISTSYETWLGAAGYSSVSFPITYSATAEKTWNFYDTYSWIATEWAFNAGIAYNSGNYYSNAKGLLSGSAARSQDDPNKLYHSVFYYDYKGRTMQTFRTHDKGGETLATKPVITNLGYNFAGEVTNEKVLYQVDGLANTETLATYEYDNTGRRLKVSHGINTAVAEVRRSEYDEAGRLKQAKIRATGTYTANGTSISGLQTIDYAYHLRGQLRGINLDGSGNPVPNASQGDLFSYKLDYETAGYYDGNIGKQYWQASTNNVAAGIRTYTFTYDAGSRLKTATYNGIGSENYSLPAINYDRNGNIISLQRNGKLTSTYGLMDNLTYSYTGNQLMKVEDTVTGDYEVDFVNRNSGSDDYSYYANGALKVDKNEAINDIIYSTYVNQPIEIQLTNNRWIKNFYDGSGRLYKTSYSTGEYWEYLDGMVFKNGAFYQLATPEGRAVYQSGGWTYEYFHTDHLGNTRVAYKASGTALAKTSETSFDPWGIVLRDAGLVNTFQNRFEYQNKEKESTFNLRRIDFGARSYNASIGRFDRVDPLAEKREWLTPYNFAQNNPLNRIDPDGALDEPCCGEVGAAVGGFFGGVGEAVVRNVKALTVDLPQTIGNMASLGSLQGQINASVGAGMLYEKTKSDWNTGDTQTRANIIGNVVGEVGIAVAGTKGAGNLGKAGVVSEAVTLEAKAIRFSQSSVTGVSEIQTSMAKSGWKGAAVDVVKMSDGKLTTLDNTRVLAASRTETPVKANVHAYDKAIPASMAERFPNKKGALPSTYGQAVENRIQNQASGFRKQYPQGGNITGSNQ